MISREDIDKLASLARMEVSDAEAEKLRTSIDSILGYVAELNEVNVSGDLELLPHEPKNIMRADDLVIDGGKHTDTLLDASPDREGEYFAVKKMF